MAEYSREKIYGHLRRVLESPLRRVVFDGESSNRNGSRATTILPVARLMLCMTGQLHLRAVVNNGGTGDLWLRAGELIYASPRNVMQEMWDTTYEMFAAIFYPEYVRLLYIRHEEGEPPPEPAPNPTLYFHTPKPLNPIGMSVVAALNQSAVLTTPAVAPEGGLELVKALLLNIRADLEACKDAARPPSRFLWNEIFNYVLENFARPELSRENVAKQFHVHPAYVSRLFKEMLGSSFIGYLKKQRFELASSLLRDPTMDIDEISEACGFRYTSYFIRAFRAHYHCTPGQYRSNLH